MKNHYLGILEDAEQDIVSRLIHINTDNQSEYYGAVLTPEEGLYHPGSSTGTVVLLAQLYYSKDSKFYQSKDFYNYMEILLDYATKSQRPDGTFDYIHTNFFSSPDTGFIMRPLAYSYQLMNKHGEAGAIKDKLYKIIEKAGWGMTNGGFHTPNHRWVISSSLLLAYSIVKEQAFKDMAEKYLAEGIDCDEYGEFTERSPGMYNIVSDEALIIIANETGDNSYLEPVKRNLDMMFFYYEPDDSIFTQNSRRQDKGYNKIYPLGYYSIFTYMAYYKNDGQYMAMANKIFNNRKSYNSASLLCLEMFSRMPFLLDLNIKEEVIPENFEAYNPSSGILRCRNGNEMITVLKNNPSFLYFQKGSIDLHIKLCSSFFAVAQFCAEDIEHIDGKYVMKFSAYGDYRMPLEGGSATTVWDDIAHDKREHVNKLSLNYTVTLEIKENEYVLNIKTTGCDRIPFKVEFCFQPGCQVETDSTIVTAKAGSHMYIKSGDFSVTQGADKLTISGAINRHTYAHIMRGSEAQEQSSFTAYFTDFTNIDQTITLSTKK